MKRFKLHMVPVLVVVVVLTSVVWFTAFGNAAEAEDLTPREQQVALGQQVFVQQCAFCHQQGGMGGALLRQNLASHGTVPMLYDYVSRSMPWGAPGSLTEEQYWAVLAFLFDENEMVAADEDRLLDADVAKEMSMQ